ncbi:MAG: mannitol dehydrogenase family protein, partial [Hyphomicrobiales bacterium]
MMLASISQNNEALYATNYDRAKCDIGVVHLGYGGFHRAHQAVYIDDYMQCTNDLRWGIAAVNLRASEAGSFEQVQKVENGYLLTTTTPDDVREMRLVRSHCQFLDWSKNAIEAENIVARSSVNMITITVTESGYYLNDDATLNIDDPIIAKEIEGISQQSIYAYLSLALRARYQANGLPINILCCDNIRSNGKMLERNFKKYLEVTGEHDLLGWIDENACFPCSMVDRITPRTSEALSQEITELFGAVGLNSINSESFKQWVVEDNFKAVMPDLPKVGTEFVADVDPYEEAKIRILNGGHTGICY